MLSVKVFSIIMDSLSIGIRADDVGRGRIILREGNYRVYSRNAEGKETLAPRNGHIYLTSCSLCSRPWIAAVAADPILMIVAKRIHSDGKHFYTSYESNIVPIHIWNSQFTKQP